MTVHAVVLPEDAAKDAVPVSQHLFRHALGDATTVEFHEPPPEYRGLAVARGWANRRDRRQVAFRRWIANQLARGHVVAVHYDADQKWHPRRRSPHEAQFDKHVRKPVAHLGRTDNLIEMVPYPEIEAWTYRNTVRALELCSADDPLHVAAAADPATLEKRGEVKDASSLGDRHNLDLVTAGWPAEGARADGRSFSRFAEVLQQCPAVRGS